VAVVAVLLLPAAWAGASVPRTFDAFYAPGPVRAVPDASPRAHDPAKPTAVVVVGGLGAEGSDVLAPYEVLTATNRFNLYTVAPERRPVPLTGGLDLVPDLTFDELATGLDGAAPELVVVPQLADTGEPTSAPVTDWLRAQAARGTQLLAVCTGAGVLASAGLLDGRPATAHWLRLTGLESRYPEVEWVRGQRVVDDGDVVSTAGILSGIDGTLHVVERFFGADVAEDAATAVGWRHYGTGSPPPVSAASALPDPVAIVNGGYRWNPATSGVVLTAGVGEIELASVFDTQAWSLATRTLAVTADGGPVRSRHGLTFLPRADVASAAPGLDRLLVPGTAAAAGRTVAPVPGGPSPEYVHDRPGFAFDATVSDLARTTDLATARWTAKVLELPVQGLVLEGPAWPWAPTGLLVVLVLLGTAGVAGARAVMRKPARPEPLPDRSTSSRRTPAETT
jgi:transcriptional regulator GlxA family with amidase domain